MVDTTSGIFEVLQSQVEHRPEDRKYLALKEIKRSGETDLRKDLYGRLGYRTDRAPRKKVLWRNWFTEFIAAKYAEKAWLA